MPEITISADSKAELRQALDRIQIGDDDSITVTIEPSGTNGTAPAGIDPERIAPDPGTRIASLLAIAPSDEWFIASDVVGDMDCPINKVRNTLSALFDSRKDYNLAERRATEREGSRKEYRLNDLGREVQSVVQERE